MNQFFHVRSPLSQRMFQRTRCMAKVVLVVCGVALLQACAYLSNESVYEGLRGADKTKTTGTTQTPAALPSYDRYDKARDALKK